MFSEGVTLLQQDRLSEAEEIFSRILGEQPNHFDALHLLGVLAMQTGRVPRGVELIGKAIAINPSFAPAHKRTFYLGLEDDQIAQFSSVRMGGPG
jgi:tetratricopeptide (TPR) repeat protein